MNEGTPVRKPRYFFNLTLSRAGPGPRYFIRDEDCHISLPLDPVERRVELNAIKIVAESLYRQANKETGIVE